jgi:hypothetical protein
VQTETSRHRGFESRSPWNNGPGASGHLNFYKPKCRNFPTLVLLSIDLHHHSYHSLDVVLHGGNDDDNISAGTHQLKTVATGMQIMPPPVTTPNDSNNVGSIKMPPLLPTSNGWHRERNYDQEAEVEALTTVSCI